MQTGPPDRVWGSPRSCLSLGRLENFLGKRLPTASESARGAESSNPLAKVPATKGCEVKLTCPFWIKVIYLPSWPSSIPGLLRLS